eukprot:5794833-Prymnesium_polylepis.1
MQAMKHRLPAAWKMTCGSMAASCDILCGSDMFDSTSTSGSLESYSDQRAAAICCKELRSKRYSSPNGALWRGTTS